MIHSDCERLVFVQHEIIIKLSFKSNFYLDNLLENHLTTLRFLINDLITIVLLGIIFKLVLKYCFTYIFLSLN